MKSYAYLAVIVLISFLLSMNTLKVFSLDEISLFLTVIGLIYGLIAAFTINNVWERFSKIRDAVAEETSSLYMTFIFMGKLSDKKSFNNFKNKLAKYCEEVPKIEWHLYWKSENTNGMFRELQGIIANIKVKNIKDGLLFDKIADELRDATGAREQQLILSQTKISKIQWALNIFLSAILVIGLVFLQIPDPTVSTFIITAMIAAVLMILAVIYELNSLKVAEEEISIEPYLKLHRLINPKSKINASDIMGKHLF